jgi:hypothetical protein
MFLSNATENQVTDANVNVTKTVTKYIQKE